MSMTGKLKKEIKKVHVNQNHCTRLTVIGGKEKGGSLCGDRSGEVTLIEPDSERGDIKIVVMAQSENWRYNIGVAQVSCEDVEEAKMRYKTDNADCGRKNPRCK